MRDYPIFPKVLLKFSYADFDCVLEILDSLEKHSMLPIVTTKIRGIICDEI